MQRNLFKFVALNSFKIVWMVSVVLITCVIANAQILQTGKDKALAPCIENFKVVAFEPKSVTVSFTTREPRSPTVNRLENWRDFMGMTWVRVDSRSSRNSNWDSPRKDHRLTIWVNIGSVAPGEKYKLDISGCKEEKEFVVPAFKRFKSLDNLRLPKPKP